MEEWLFRRAERLSPWMEPKLRTLGFRKKALDVDEYLSNLSIL